MSISKRKSTDDARDSDYGTRLDPADLLAEYIAAPEAETTAKRSGKLDFGDDADTAKTDSAALSAGARSTASDEDDHDHDHDHDHEDEDIFADHLLHEHEHGDPEDELGGGGAEGPLPLHWRS